VVKRAIQIDAYFTLLYSIRVIAKDLLSAVDNRCFRTQFRKRITFHADIITFPHLLVERSSLK